MKIAWTYGYIFLKQISEKDYDIKNVYYDTMKDIISRGGDTDTNACIVGGLIGALVGI